MNPAGKEPLPQLPYRTEVVHCGMNLVVETREVRGHGSRIITVVRDCVAKREIFTKYHDGNLEDAIDWHRELVNQFTALDEQFPCGSPLMAFIAHLLNEGIPVHMHPKADE